MKKEKMFSGLILTFSLLLLSAPVILGQEPVAEGQKVAEDQKVVEDQEIEISKYKGLGKRDPFMSLLNLKEEDRNKVVQPPPLEDRPPGLTGLLISEVSVAGVAAGKTKQVIVLKGIDGISYIAQPGSNLFDGILKEVNDKGVTFTRTAKTTDGKSKSYKVTKPFNSSEKQVLP
jgi:hypothetical protein